MNIHDALKRLIARHDLSEKEMEQVMTQVMEGGVAEAPLAAFLTALTMKGETVEEILGAARVMRAKSEKLSVNARPVVDTCGTGGDGGQTFNVSTCAAFVVAGAGVTVAKHGNRAVSSRSGSADVLKALGVNIDAGRETVERCLAEVGIGFLFAPLLHGAMKHAAAVRRALGFRTVFNLLGPLTNPASADCQVVGVFEDRWVRPVAEVLLALGARHAFVVHGADGMDEITIVKSTHVCELEGGSLKEYFIAPEDVGLSRALPEAIRGGTPEENAEFIRAVLGGQAGARTDIVLMNAAAALVAAGKAASLKDGVEAARGAIASGAALDKLAGLCRVSQS